MSQSPMHAAVALVAEERGAMVIHRELLFQLVMHSLETAVAFGSSCPVPFPSGYAGVSSRFRPGTFDPSSLTLTLVDRIAGPVVGVQPGFELSIEVFASNDPALIFSQINFTVPSFELSLSAGGDFITFADPEVDVTAQVIPAPSRADAKRTVGVSDDDLLRLEGALAFVAGSRLVSSALGKAHGINLREMFPPITFSGSLEIVITADALVVIPENFAFIGNPGCPQGDATGGMVIAPGQPAGAGNDRKYPVFTQLPVAPAHVRPTPAPPAAALYLPKKILDLHFEKAAPAVSYRDSDNGFIGWDARLTAAIKGFTVSIDEREGALRLGLDFSAWGLVLATIDVPCVGRQELAQLHFEMPENNGAANVEALLRVAVDTGGRLLMTSELTKLDLGKAHVSLQLVGKYAGLGGGYAAISGFLFDAVLAKIMAHNLPPLVAQAIRNAVNDKFFVLADLNAFAARLRDKPNAPSFSGDPDSTLMGLASLQKSTPPIVTEESERSLLVS